MGKSSNFLEYEKTNNQLLLELFNHNPPIPEYETILDTIFSKNCVILLPPNQNLMDLKLSIPLIQSHVVYRNSKDPTMCLSLNGIRYKFNNEFTQLNVISGPPIIEKLYIELARDPFSVFEDKEKFETFDKDSYLEPKIKKLHVLRTSTYTIPSKPDKQITFYLISEAVIFLELLESESNSSAKKKNKKRVASLDDSYFSSKLLMSSSLPNFEIFTNRIKSITNSTLSKSKSSSTEQQMTLAEYLRQEKIPGQPTTKQEEEVQNRINKLLSMHENNNTSQSKRGSRLFTEEALSALQNADDDSDTSSEKSTTSRASVLSETTVKSKTFNFSDFVEKMRHQSSIDLVKKIKKFINDLNKAEYVPENSENKEASFSYRVQKFLIEVMKEIREHPQWKNASELEMDNAREGIEKYVMTKLYSKVFSPTVEDLTIDNEIAMRFSLFSKRIEPSHLDLDPNLVTDNESAAIDPSIAAQIKKAITELKKINSYKTPRDKMICISNCCKLVINILSTYYPREQISADIFLPVIIYLVMKANPPHLHSNLKYISEYRNPDKMLSESAYYLTNLQSSALFWRTADHNSFSISKEEFDEWFGKELSSVQQGNIFFHDSDLEEERFVNKKNNVKKQSKKSSDGNTNTLLNEPDASNVSDLSKSDESKPANGSDVETVHTNIPTTTTSGSNVPSIELEVKRKEEDVPIQDILLATPSNKVFCSFPSNSPTEQKVAFNSQQETKEILGTIQLLTDSPNPSVQEQNQDLNGTLSEQLSIQPPLPAVKKALQQILEFEKTSLNLEKDSFYSISNINDLRIGDINELLSQYKKLHDLVVQIKSTLESENAINNDKADAR